MKPTWRVRACPVLPLSLLLLLLAAAGCTSEDDADTADVPSADVAGGDAPAPPVDTPVGGDVPSAADVPGGGDDTPTSADVPVPADVAPPPPEHLADLTPDLSLQGVAGLDGRVRLYRDRWGVPHVYATTRHDAFFAQGFVTAVDRITQMHLFRMAGAGRMAEVPAMGPGELSADVYMRTINLRDAAAATWELLQQPGGEEAVQVLTAFAAGVNAYVQALRDGSLPTPPDLLILGGPALLQEWTPVDSLIVGRVQSWDLSFDGLWDEAVALAKLMELQERFGATALAGIVDDVFDYRSYTDATILPTPAEPQKAAARPSPRASDLARRPFYARLGKGALRGLERVRALREQARILSSRDDWGSNSWAVAGAHTASGAPILANDPHLALRNPAIFYENHMDTTLAGGDLSLAGVSFPGIPGMILGRNAHVAWSATVFYADVTDVYVESLVPGVDGAPDAVVFEGANVPLVSREEVLYYRKPLEGCDDMLSDWTEDYDETVEDVGDGRCRVTLHIQEVPHHGPVIPGTRSTGADGQPIVLTWKWTGFQPTEDLRAVLGFNLARDADDFLEAARLFGVGNQNWLAIDTHGSIAYAAWMLVPRRPWTEQDAVAYVPWLPLPGTGEAEWDGWVAREDLPNVKDPERGWIVTANNDGAGVSFDGDPLNDGKPFHGYGFDIGFRAERIQERLAERVAAGGITIADLQAIQADHHSPLGEHLRPALLAALAAQEGEGTARETEAVGYLTRWTLAAADGVWPGATQEQIDDSIATSIFNAWVTFVTRKVFDDKGLGDLPDQLKGRMLLRMVEQPATMATYDAASGESLLWDDVSTTDTVETRDEILVRSFRKALDFLSDPEAVGVAEAGGFGTDDMTQWRWGKLHTVQLTHPLGGTIPPESTWPEGYPRHGDRFSVDASHSPMASTRYRYTSGPAMRAVYELTPAAPRHECVIAGGEEGRPFARHYQDEMALWAQNQAHPILHVEEELLPAVEWTLQLEP